MLAALRRSVQLTSGRRWQILVAMMLCTVIAYVGVIVFQGPFLVAMMLSARAGQQPEWLVFASSVFGAIGGSITGSLVMIVLVLCYYDTRIRKEAFDLQFMICSSLSAGPGTKSRNGISCLRPHSSCELSRGSSGPYSHAEFLASLWTCPANAQAPSRSLSLQQYIAQLHAASDILNNASAAAGTASVHDFRPGPPHQVDSGFGWTIRAGKNGLVGERSGNRGMLLLPDAADRLMPARERLAALMDAAESLSAAPSGAGATAEKSRARLDRILSDREFQGANGPTWFDKLKARVFAWIAKYLDKLFGSVGVSAATGSAIAWVLVLIVAILLAYWGVRYWVNVARRAEMDLSGAAPAWSPPIGPPRLAPQPTAAITAPPSTPLIGQGSPVFRRRAFSCWPDYDVLLR